MGNNWVGWQLLRVLRGQGADLVGLVAHPPDRQKYRAEIVAEAGLPADRVFDAARLRDPAVIADIAALKPDIAVCGCFGYILRKPLVDVFPRGVVNSHISLLPYNRGAFPNVWAIIDRTPAGVSLHYIDGGVDTGDLIAQKEVPVEPTDTGQSLYGKLERAAVELFTETWPKLRAGTIGRTPQDHTRATGHKLADVASIDEIDPDATYTGRELIDRIRARTFPPYKGTYFVDNGRRVYLRLELEYGDEPPREGS
jgi:methionyl-tRNA formyltransferase